MSQTTHSTVEYSIADGIAHVEIDRAEKLNSLTREVFEDLVEAGLALQEATEVKAVVLSGRGRAFSAGLDFTELSRIAEDGAVELGPRLGSARALAQKAVHIWSLVEVPVIAAIRGAALGGGDADRPGGGHARGRPRCEAVADGAQVGHHPRYVRHPAAAAAGRSR